MQYCKACLSPDTRPNGRFNSDGVCAPCEFMSGADDVDYAARFDELAGLVADLSRSRRRSRWHCIVGVSGGKDSTRQALWVREQLGVNPLLVCIAYPPRQMSDTGAKNISNLASLGFDVHYIGPAPKLSRQLVREAFIRFGNFAKPTEMALFAGVPRIALEKRIPVILWGENPALQVGDSKQLGSDMWDGNSLIMGNTLAGGDLTWFAEVAGGLDRLRPYQFPTAEELRRGGIQTIFLGPAWRDWGAEQNSLTSLAHGLTPRPLDGPTTDDPYGTSMLDERFMTVHFLLKYYKLGFGRATEIASGLIRRNILTRGQAIELVEKHDGKCPEEDIEAFCRYVGLATSEFWSVVRGFTDARLFDVSTTRPTPRFKVGIGVVR